MDAEPWRLGCGSSRGDGDGRKKMKRVVNHSLWRSIYTGPTCGSFHCTEISTMALSDNFTS
jgi:hypothetical protein